MFNWIKNIDEGTILWKCPACGARTIPSCHDIVYCQAFYCYKCGTKNSDFNPGDDKDFPLPGLDYQISFFDL